MNRNLARSLTHTPKSPNAPKEKLRKLNSHKPKDNPFLNESLQESENILQESPKFSHNDINTLRKQTMESKSSIQSPKKSSVILKINLGPQGTKKVKCKIGDDPEELAKSFVEENDLAPDAIHVIIKMMKKQLKEMAKRLTEASKDEIKTDNDFSFSPHGASNQNRLENIALTSSESETAKEKTTRKSKLKAAAIVAKMSVKLKPNESKEIKILENEDPDRVVSQFCNENGLSTPAKDAIMKNLLKMIKKSKPSIQNQDPPQIEPLTERSEQESVNKFNQDEQENENIPTRPTQADSVTPSQDDSIMREKVERYEQWQNLLNEKKEIKKREAEKERKNNRGSAEIRKLFDVASTALENKKKAPRKSSQNSREPKKKASPQGRTMTVEEAKKSGQRLHSLWKKKQDKFERQRAELKEKREKEEMADVTFSPNRMHSFKRYLSTEPRQHSYMDTARYFHQKKRYEQIGWEMWAEECPFQPKVNKSSRDILNRSENGSTVSIHESLYQRGLQHKKHMEEWQAMAFEDHYKFHPTLITDIHDFLPNRNHRTQAEFTENLYNDAKERDKRFLQKRLERYQSVDPYTGRKLFQPTVNHDEYYWKVKTRDDAYFNLMVDVSNWKVKTLIEEKDKIQQEEKEDPDLRALFNELDSDRDGFISIQKINLDSIDHNMTQLLAPFIDFMSNERPKLNFIDFCRAIESFGLHEVLKIDNHRPEIMIQEIVEAESESTSKEISTPRGSKREEQKSAKSKAGSKKSDSSTTTSVMSDQKVLPRHYQKLLTKHSNDK